jgi:hypothetical protein
MMESWDPAVVLLFKAIGYLLLSTVLGAVLYSIIKHAVSAGIKLAADDLRKLAKSESSRRE